VAAPQKLGTAPGKGFPLPGLSVIEVILHYSMPKPFVGITINAGEMKPVMPYFRFLEYRNITPCIGRF